METNELYSKTDNGFCIIEYYYPAANKKGEMFKIRDERTPSASCKQFNGIWYVTDFGENSKAKSPIDVVIAEENCDYATAMRILESRYGLAGGIAENKPQIESRTATKEEPDGYFSYVCKEKFSDRELVILGKGVKQEHCDRYSWRSLSSYTLTKGTKTFIIKSTDSYPIFMRECHVDNGSSFYKIYQPMAQDKARRFFYRGEKPSDYINGLYELKGKYRQNVDKTSDGEDDSEPKKLDECVICSGERDALCCAARGCYPVWLNSETASFSSWQMGELLSMCKKVYNIPDIDRTGQRQAKAKAIEHLDLYTVELPASLMLHKDHRGNPCKDFRDWCEYNSKQQDFNKLLSMAKRCRFWGYKPIKDDYAIVLEPVFLTYFLEMNGFGKIIDRQTKKIIYVHVEDYKVTEVVEAEIMTFVRRFIEEKMLGLDVQKLMTTSSNVNKSIESLRDITDQIDFKNYTMDSQTLFFANEAIRIDANSVKEIKDSEKIGCYTWEKNICKHDFKRLDKSFSITCTNGHYDLDIINLSSHFLRFCLNSCRLYWREELEMRTDFCDEDNKAYIENYKFSVQGSRLTEEEIDEQVQCLANRIYSIGYMLHSYKDSRNPRICWLLENNMVDDESSSGGSGKSFIVSMLQTLKPTVTLDGRNRHFTENQHFLDRVSEYTDILYIDDATKLFDFDSFYTLATGNMSVNAKHKDSKEIAFKDSPKLMISSNFAPNRNDESTLRRILFMPVSDYYHKRTDDNNYHETRRISDDFGYELYNEKYSETDWNADYNFLVDCVQFYLQMTKRDIVVEPNMSSISKRMNLAVMGTQFNEWALAYFAKDSEYVDIILPKEKAMVDFQTATNIRGWSSAKFTKSLKSFCACNSSYIIGLNPAELCLPSDPTRIVKKVGGISKQCIYVQTKQEINSNLKGEYY